MNINYDLVHFTIIGVKLNFITFVQSTDLYCQVLLSLIHNIFSIVHFPVTAYLFSELKWLVKSLSILEYCSIFIMER